MAPNSLHKLVALLCGMVALLGAQMKSDGLECGKLITLTSYSNQKTESVHTPWRRYLGYSHSNIRHKFHKTHLNRIHCAPNSLLHGGR